MGELKIEQNVLGINLMYKEIIEGLSKPEKELPSKYFYDELGSQLFEKITELNEYYITRTELKIMIDKIQEISEVLGEKLMFIEYGSGSSEKIKIILDNVKGICTYVPIDISCEHLSKSAEQIAKTYKHLEVLPVCADYNKSFTIPEPRHEITHKIVYFPGSTIGNFHPPQAKEFLEHIAEVAGKKGGLLIGVDLKKDTEVLNAAYNDKKGVTAEFNLNQLRHINRELGSDFDLQNFEHDAFYNKQKGRIEMHLISIKDQQVNLNGSSFSFKKGERIWTESSYKYSLDEFASLAKSAGFEVHNIWTDEKEYFSVQYLEVD